MTDDINIPEESLAKHISNLNVASVLIGIEGDIISCNDHFTKLVKKAKDQIIGNNLAFDVFKIEQSDHFLKKLVQIAKGEDSNLNYLAEFSDSMEVKFTILPIKDSSDSVSKFFMLGASSHISNGIQQPIKTHYQLQELFENSNDLIQIFSIDGKLLFVNEAWKIRLGYRDEEIESLNLKDIIAPDFLEITKQRLFRIANGEPMNRLETTFIAKDGVRIHLSGHVTCNYHEGKTTEFRVIFHDITDQIKAEKARALYYSIANLTAHSLDLDNLYENIHAELSKVIDAKNFYISLTNEDQKTLTFPYYIDEHHPGKRYERTFKNGITEYAIVNNKPMFLREKELKRLQEQQVIVIQGNIPLVWLGVPLRLEKRTIGIIAVQSYSNRNAYTYNDLELLDFISGQIALSIERKRSEDKINSQTARINAIFESGSHLIWSVNHAHQFTSFNQNFANSFKDNFGQYPVLHQRYDYNIKSPSRMKLLKKWDDAYDKAFEGNQLNFEYKTIVNGKEDWKEIFLNPISSKDNSYHEVSGIAHDITEKKTSELALQKSEEKFRNIFESFQDIYFRCRLNGEITVISPSVKELVGYDPKKVLGANITDYYLYTSKTKRLIRELIKHKAVRNFEASIIQKDGRILQCICNVRFIYEKYRPIEIEGVARDITQLKKTNQELVKAKEIAEKSSKVKDQFLANMSHEIRTPMNGIIGMIDLISGTTLNKEQKNYIQTIKKSSQTLLNILNDILDLSKIEAGKMKLKMTPLRVKTVMEKLYAMFSQQALSRNTNLYYHIDKQLPEYIFADETRLLQILSNLTSNAIKFTEGGGSIDIGVKKYKRGDMQNMIRVDVTDSGIGISKENVDNLFMSFNQLDESFTKSYGGTGLGLSISKELCRLMGGDIGVFSTEGLGSTFWFTFKAEPADEQVVEEFDGLDEHFDIANYFEGKKPKVLLVDDNLVNRQVAGEILKKSGCRVDIAVSGTMAIEKVKKKRYDLIFMDIQMPDMDGVTATKNIKALNFKKLAPIVAMTAYSMKEDRDRFISQGLDDYIPKPIRAHELIQKVQDWVKYKPKTTQKVETPINLQEKVINEDIIGQLKKYGGDDMIKKVYSDFESESIEQLDLCKISFKNKNYQNILSNLHTLKGNAGTLGVEKVAKYAEYIESNLKKENYETLEQDLDFLNLTFAEFQNSYNKIINS